MPGLLRGIARTAVIAGTASGVAGRVQRHQASKFAERDAQTAADRTGYYRDDLNAQQQPPQQQVPDQRSAPDTSSMLEQLKELGELKASGVLTEQEFGAQKARILAGG
jgi:hypothetical protein